MAKCTEIEESPPRTLCDGDRKDNVWIEGVVNDDATGGICTLDTLDESQVTYILQRDEKARADLLRVTTNKRLLELARTVTRLAVDSPEDALRKGMNKGTIPFYTIFAGKPPFAR